MINVSIESLIIFLFAFMGAVASVVTSWLSKEEPFNPKKFIASLLLALMFAATLFMAQFTGTIEVTLQTLLLAFTGGFTFEVAVDRVYGGVLVHVKRNIKNA